MKSNAKTNTARRVVIKLETSKDSDLHEIVKEVRWLHILKCFMIVFGIVWKIKVVAAAPIRLSNDGIILEILPAIQLIAMQEYL